MRPEFFYQKDVFEPFFMLQKQEKQRIKEKKGQNGVDEEQRTPDPEQRKKEDFEEFSHKQGLKLETTLEARRIAMNIDFIKEAIC
ncbi:MAG: hypothetical protein ACKOQ6_12330 [Bacteroidota bacterium]